MRVAVALPALPASSPLRSALLATLRGLSDRGVELEGFAEEPRDYDAEGLPTFHYLRLAERHRRRAFETALYPLGRDWRPYDAALILMDRFPGVVWVLDPVPHHLLVGGTAMRSRWDAYRTELERGLGNDLGGAVAMTVASGWAVRATYRRFDPMPAILREQRSVCAATPSIAREFERLGTAATIVPLEPLPAPAQLAAPRACRRLLLLTFHYGWPAPVLGALERLLGSVPELELRVVVPELVHQVAIGPAAQAMGIADRIHWVFHEERLLPAAAAEADLVVHLRDDPTAGERALIETALQRGAPALMLRVEGAGDFPDAVVPRVEPGRALPESFAGMVEAIAGDPELFAGLSAASREFAAGRPGPTAAAGGLASVLHTAAAGGARLRDTGAFTRELLGERMRDAAIPAGAEPALRHRMDAILQAAIPERLR